MLPLGYNGDRRLGQGKVQNFMIDGNNVDVDDRVFDTGDDGNDNDNDDTNFLMTSSNLKGLVSGSVKSESFSLLLHLSL